MLDQIRIGASPLTGKTYLYRLGKRGEVLEKREAEAEVMDAACQSVLYGFPTGAKVDCTIAGRRYEVTVKPLPNGEKEG